MDKQDQILEILKDIQRNLTVFAGVLGFIAVAVAMIGSKLQMYWWQ